MSSLRNGQPNSVSSFLNCGNQGLNPSVLESDIIHVNLLGQPVIVLNSVESAVDLLEKRGANYSGRPSFAVMERYLKVYGFGMFTDISLVWAFIQMLLLWITTINSASSGSHTGFIFPNVAV